MEKRGWVAWFTRGTNKTSRQEACTTYVGRRRPSVLPKERRHWGLPGRILEAQAKLVSLVGSALQMETQPEWERERDMGRPVFRETDPNSLFSMVYFYTLRCYAKVTWGQQSWLYQSQVLHTKVYRGLRGVTSSSGRGACWQFMTLSLWQRSVNQDTYFSRGDYFWNIRHLPKVPDKVTFL